MGCMTPESAMDRKTKPKWPLIERTAVGATPGAEQPQPAYFDWGDFDPEIHPGEGVPMAEELATYGKHLRELLPRKGEFVLIKGSEIFGVYATIRKALKEAVARFGDEPALVKEIVQLEPIDEVGHVVP